MNTSAEAKKLLEQSLSTTRQAVRMLDDLLVPHDYQDAAALVAKAAAALLEAGTLLMQSDSDAALDAVERADDLLDALYSIIDSETDDDES